MAIYSEITRKTRGTVSAVKPGHWSAAIPVCIGRPAAVNRLED